MELKVCIGSACHIKGSYNVITSFQQLIEANRLFEQVELKAVFCLGHCTNGVSVQIDDGEIYGVTGTTARTFFKEHIMDQLEPKHSTGIEA